MEIKNKKSFNSLIKSMTEEILDEIKISNKDADDIIMRARSSWFED